MAGSRCGHVTGVFFRPSWTQTPALILICQVTLGFWDSEPVSSAVKHEHHTYLPVWLWELIINHMKLLAYTVLAYNTYINDDSLTFSSSQISQTIRVKTKRSVRITGPHYLDCLVLSHKLKSLVIALNMFQLSLPPMSMSFKPESYYSFYVAPP